MRAVRFEPGEARHLAVIPFDSNRKLMATLDQMPGAGPRMLVMNRWFHTAPLAARDWLLPDGIGLGIFLLVEVEKALGAWLEPGRIAPTRFTVPRSGT